MSTLIVKVKKLHGQAQLPAYSSDGAGCFDLHAVDVLNAAAHPSDPNAKIYRTGLAFEIPAGYVMFIYSRSGHGFNQGVRLSNCVGVIDSDYRGEVRVSLRFDAEAWGHQRLQVANGDRIAQAVILPRPAVAFDLAEQLSATERGDGGFGSTGGTSWTL